LFFGGQSISQIGTWMQRTGVIWVIYTMTHSTFMLGLTVFATQFPSFLFSLVGGIVSDRHNRHKILLITQTASMLQAVVLAVLALTNHFVVWEILSLSAVLGVINAFDVPARHPLVNEFIEVKADLPNALALNSSMANLARLIGPALSGIVLQKYGAGMCFLLNAISFIAVILSLLLIKPPAYIPPTGKTNMTTGLKEGFVYFKNTPAIGMVIVMITLISLLVLPYSTLLPVFAKVIFRGDAATFGYINSFIGIGAICGTFFLASLKPGTNLRMILLMTTVILGIGLICFSCINIFALAMLFATISGFGTMAQTTVTMTIVQMEAEPAMRGRVISYIAMALFGMLPVGSLLIGAISQRLGAPETIFGQGIIALLIAALFAWFLKKDIREKKYAQRIEKGNENGF
jgi:MFS family permease